MAVIPFSEFVIQFLPELDGAQFADVPDWLLERIVSQLGVPRRVLQGEPAVPREPSSEEKGFIRAFWCADYGDPLPRLVYADWLDEHGFAAEAERARADLPPLDCNCGGASRFTFRRVLICWACWGRGTLLGAGPDRGNPSCHRCDGKGEIRCGVVCATCNGRWVPPKITKAQPGDLLWAWDSLVRMQTRPRFQGDRPWFTAVVHQGHGIWRASW